MRITESCAQCLYDRQKRQTSDADYLAEVKALLDARREEDTSPYLVYQFGLAHQRRFGRPADYREIKRRFNDLVLGLEAALARRVQAAPDPLEAALVMARVGNYIDYGAMDSVSEEVFLSLFGELRLRPEERETYRAFLEACAGAKRFLLVTDNCGEIVLDRLLLEQLKLRFPQLHFTALVRGGEVLNDATEADARYAGLDRAAEIVSNGLPIAGTVHALLPPAAKAALEGADVVLAKGQGNYESLSGQGWPAFYAFLCKCELFTERFGVPQLTGMLVQEAV